MRELLPFQILQTVVPGGCTCNGNMDHGSCSLRLEFSLVDKSGVCYCLIAALCVFMEKGLLHAVHFDLSVVARQSALLGVTGDNSTML